MIFTKTAQQVCGLFIFSPYRYLLRDFLDRRQIERVEYRIDDAVCAEDDHQTDEAPKDTASALFAFRLITRVHDELEHAP